jgi:hypothetical protein
MVHCLRLSLLLKSPRLAPRLLYSAGLAPLLV